MPSGPIELHEKWEHDGNAWDALKTRFIDDRGIIRPKDGVVPTEEEWSAINYLCFEWDYGYEPCT